METNKKSYKCGCCGTVAQVQTNHFGEIYSDCPYCGNGVRTCIEEEAKILRDKKEKSYVKLAFYRYDLSNNAQKEEYSKFLEKRGGNVRWVDIQPFSGMKFHRKWEGIKELCGKNITIYDVDQFEDQYVAMGLRLHSWVECIFPNKDIKQGYYLIFKGKAK